MNARIHLTLALFMGSLGLISVQGQYGSVDPTFNPIDDGTYGDGAMQFHSSYSEPNGSVSSLLERPDGRILVHGQFNTYNGEQVGSPLCVLPDGQRDPTYILDAPLGFSGGRMIMLPDGGLLVAGYQGGMNKLLRFAVSGAWDPAFQVTANNTIIDLALMPDGRILMAGNFTEVNGEPVGRLARLLEDGQVDSSFSINADWNNQIRRIVPTPDGHLLVGGTFSALGGVPRRGLARLHEDGTLDTVFDPMANASSNYVTVNVLRYDDGGRILVGGAFEFPGVSAPRNLLRLISDGTVDTTFTTGTGPSSSVYDIALRPDGSMIVGGAFLQYDGHLRRALVGLLPDGGIDTTFTTQVDHAFGPIVHCVTLASNDDVIVGGRISSVEGRFRMGLARLNANGALVTTFNPGRGAGGLVRGMALMADGRIAIAGDHVSYNDSPRPYLSFLTSDGDLHPTFNGGAGPNGPVLLLQPLVGERLFIAGKFTAYDGVPVPRMAVVDAFGVLDTTVNFPSDALPIHMWPSAAIAFPDGSLLLASMPEYQPYNWTSALQRFMPDGSLDQDFTPPGPIYGGIRAMALQQDGRILLGGSLRIGSPSATLGIARLMPDGSVDASFSVGVGVAPASYGSVSALAPLPDGRIIIGGWFTHYRGVPASGIACLMPDGTRSPDFSTFGLTSAYVDPPGILSIAPLPDGRLVLTGWFNTYGGAPHNGMAIALPDGTQDASFSIGSGPEYVSKPYISQVLVDEQGRYIIRGLFHRFDGVARHRIARLLGGGGVGVDDLQALDTRIQVWPNPATDVLYIARPFTGSIFDARGQLVREVVRTQTIGLLGLPSGPYVLRHTDGLVTRFVKQ